VIRDEKATACRAAPVLDNKSIPETKSEPFSDGRLGLTITSTSQGRFVYWKGFEPSELLEDHARLVATIHNLPFQVGRPLSPIQEDQTTETAPISGDSSGDHSLDHEVCMASIHDTDDDEPGIEFNNELLDEILGDENTAEAPQDKDAEHRRIRRSKNAKRAKRMHNVELRARNAPLQRNHEGEFTDARDRQFRTPKANIARAAM